MERGKRSMEGTYKYSYKVGENLMNSLSVCNVGHQRCEPGYQWGPGVRNHYCIHYVISGKGYYEVNGVVRPLVSGDLFILYPDAQVKYYADEKKPWEYAWVGFMGEDADSLIRATDFTQERPWIERGALPKREVHGQLDDIYKVKGNTYDSAVAMTGALYTFLSTLMRHASPPVEQVRDGQLVYVEKAKDYITNNYSYPITVEEIAEYVGISRSHLFRAFKSHVQQSPKEYLTEFRIKRARQMLRETTLSVSTIAYSVGFDNNLYFSKAFKDKMKTNPSEYRKIAAAGMRRPK